jgi:hypothetical protein
MHDQAGKSWLLGEYRAGMTSHSLVPKAARQRHRFRRPRRRVLETSFATGQAGDHGCCPGRNAIAGRPGPTGRPCSSA